MSPIPSYLLRSPEKKKKSIFEQSRETNKIFSSPLQKNQSTPRAPRQVVSGTQNQTVAPQQSIPRNFTPAPPVQSVPKTPIVAQEPQRRFFPKVRERAGDVIEKVQDTREFVREKSKTFLKRSGVQALKMGADALENFTSYTLRNPDKVVKKAVLPTSISAIPKIDFNPEEESWGEKTKRQWQEFADEMIASGYNPTRRAQEAMNKIAEADFMQPSQEWVNSSTKEKLTTKLPQTLYELGPSVVGSLGVYAISPTVGFSATVGSTAEQVQNDAITYGVPKEDAERLGLAVGIPVGLVDRIVPAKIFGGKQAKDTFVKGLFRRLAEKVGQSGLRGIEEGGTEAAQEAIVLAAESTFREDLQFGEVASRLALNSFMGLFGGAGVNLTVEAIRATRGMELPVGLSIKDVSGEQDKINAELKEQKLYHATNQEFDEFVDNDKGIFFTDESGIETIQESDPERFAKVKEVVVEPKNTFVMNEVNLKEIIDAKPDLQDKLDRVYSRQTFRDAPDAVTQAVLGKYLISDETTRQIITDELKSSGYDSIKLDGDVFVSPQGIAKPVNSFVVLDKKIIKKPAAKIEPSKAAQLQYERDAQIQQRQEQELEREQEIIQARELDTTFPDSEQESGFQQFKSLVSKNKKILELEDETQLKAYLATSDAKYTEQFGTTQDVDNILFSGARELSNNELLDLYKQRIELEQSAKQVAKQKTPSEQKAISKKKVEKIVRKETKGETPKPQKAIKEQTGQSPAPFVRKRETTLLKEKLKNLARGSREGRVDQRQETRNVQKEIRTALKESKLSPKDREKFSDMLKNVQTEQQLEKKMPEVEDRIKRLEEKADRRAIVQSIQKKLKKTKPKKTGKTPKGRYTADVQAVLDAARSALKLTIEQAQKQILANLQTLEQFNNQPNPDTKKMDSLVLQNKILAMRYKSVESLQQLEKEIDSIIEGGEVSADLKAFNESTEVQQAVDLLRDVIPSIEGVNQNVPKTTRQKVKAALASLGKRMVLSWQGKLEALGTYSTANDTRLQKEFSLVKEEDRYKTLQENFFNDFGNIIRDSYKIKGGQFALSKKINQLKKEIDYGVMPFNDGKKQRLVLTRDQAIKRYMEFQDPSLFDSFVEGNGYSHEIFQAITDSLSQQDKAFAHAQLEMYKKQYNGVNEVYSKMNGVDLPFNEFYSPIRRKDFKLDATSNMGEFLTEVSYMPGVGAGSLNARVGTKSSILEQDSTTVMMRHFAETNYYIAWAEKIRRLNAIFGDVKVTEPMKYFFGDSMVAAMNRDIQQLASKGKSTGDNIKWLDWVRTKYTVGSLMIKPAIFVKQTLSAFAYIEQVGHASFLSGVTSFFKNPIKNTRTLNKESAFLRNRIDYKERDLTDAMNSNNYKVWSKQKTLLNTLMMNVSLGDKLPILIGSWAIRRKALKEGKSVEEAIRLYTEFGQETQQSSDVSRLADIQKMNSFAKLFTMFLSTPRSYFQKELNAVRSLLRKDGLSFKNIARVAKTIYIYHILLPVIFQLVSSGFGDDEEDIKEYKRAATLGSFNGLMIAGGMIDSTIRAALGLKVWPQEIPIVTAVNDVGKLIKSYQPDDITLFDWAQFMDGAAGVGQSLGVPTQFALTGYEAIDKIIRKDYKAALLNIAGWSDYAIDYEKTVTLKEEMDEQKEFYRKAVESGKMTSEAAQSALGEQYDKIFAKRKKEIKKSIKELSREEAKTQVKELHEFGVLTKDESVDILGSHYDYLDKKEKDVEEELEKVENAKEKGVLRKPDPDIIENEPLRDIVERSVKAFGVDPLIALKAFFSSEKINIVTDNRVGLQRLDKEVTEEYKKKYGAIGPDYRLEHIVPRAIGGSNKLSSGNYLINKKDQWEEFTKADVLVINAVEADKISPSLARKLIKQFKDGDISFEQLKTLVE